MPDLNLIDAYDYDLPEELIAQTPCQQRDQSRLMIWKKAAQELAHRQFCDLVEQLRPHDCLVLNQTRVVPARLRGVRDQTGGKWEGLFLRVDASGEWELIGQTRGKLQPGETVTVRQSEEASGVPLEFLRKDDQGRWRVRPIVQPGQDLSPWNILDQVGSIPLPPYIQHGIANTEDRERYQTVYAQIPGAVAAPTAGLHFTPELMARCREQGAEFAAVTLHVGLGTFRPIAVQQLDQHDMHSEWCQVTAETVETIQKCKTAGGRVIAVGTTSVRTLETASQSGQLQPWEGESNLFIRPGYQFQTVEGLITNYHLPRSTLLVLLSALIGHDTMQHLYREAVQERYRFYSYGDAMLILP